MNFEIDISEISDGVVLTVYAGKQLCMPSGIYRSYDLATSALVSWGIN